MREDLKAELWVADQVNHFEGALWWLHCKCNKHQNEMASVL